MFGAGDFLTCNCYTDSVIQFKGSLVMFGDDLQPLKARVVQLKGCVALFGADDLQLLHGQCPTVIKIV
jgi:hypothetical protein